MQYRLLIATLCAALLGSAAAGLAADRANNADTEGFAWIQVTDIHVDAHLARMGPAGAVRGAETIDWICQQAKEPQALPLFEITTPKPAFAIATGDLTEFGVIDDTWQIFEHAFSKLGIPLYVLPGNHDNTWNAMYRVMRAERGSENYAFDHGGLHFVCISSASPQEPVPSIDGKTRAWLRRDLASLKSGAPIVLALHHPPNSGEFAPAESDTLFDMLGDYNVVLILCGHGHSVWHKQIAGIDTIMGGSTFGKNAGYTIFSVQDDRLRVAYRYHQTGDSKKPAEHPQFVSLLDKSLADKTPRRLLAAIKPGDARAEKAELKLCVRPKDPATKQEFSFFIDGEQIGFSPQSADPADAGTQDFTMPLGERTPGLHLLTVRAVAIDGTTDVRTATFAIEHPDVRVAWRRDLPAAIKAGPVVAGDLLMVAGTDGVVRGLDKRDGSEKWTYQAAAEILGTPALADGFIVFGDGEGGIHAVNVATGQPRWQVTADQPVYGTPLIADGVAYLGDNGGKLHAIDLADGKTKWTFARADYTIESQPAVFGDYIVFGAWDGYIYALNRADGSLAWKSLGAKASDGKAVRYYAPADCGPVALSDRLFVCDRGYQLGSFDAEGKLQQTWDDKISGIVAAPSGQRLYARTTDDRVIALETTGNAEWTANLPAGRFPIPPTVASDSLYVCSNTGVLSAVATSNGTVRWQYQVTPGYYVMAPVAVDSSDTAGHSICFVAGMDGSITALVARTDQTTASALPHVQQEQQ